MISFDTWPASIALGHQKIAGQRIPPFQTGAHLAPGTG